MEDLQPLDNCEIFRQIRNAFTSYHNQKKKLQSFVYFSGNEDGIKELAGAVLSVLQEHELVQLQSSPNNDGDEENIAQPMPGANVDQLRGTWMYLMLNSANGDSKACHWSPQCVHLLNQLPAQMPQLVTISVTLLSGMQNQLFEFLACGPHWLTRQYFDSFNETLSHLVRDKCAALRLVCSALCSVTKSICYQALVGDDCSATSAALVSNAQRLLQRHVLNTEERLRGLHSAAARRRYLGEAVHQLFDVALDALEALKTPPQLPKYFQLYALRPLVDTSGVTTTAAGTTTTEAAQHVVSKLQGYVEKLLDAVEGLLPLVSVDTYMRWAEMESGRLLFHLQGHICSQAKRLQQLLEEDEVLRGHSLRPQLTTFAGGAQSFEERLAALSLGELLSLLDEEMGVVSDEQLLAGLEELLKRSIAFGNEECVETMAKHVRLLGAKHARLILDHLAQVKQMRIQQKEEEPQHEGMESDEMEVEVEQDEKDGSEEDDDDMYSQLLRQVLYPIFENCTTKEKVKLLELRDTMKLLGHFSFKLDYYDERRVFFFNQLTNSQRDFPMNNFLDLCYEQPQQSWLSLAELAMVQSNFKRLYVHVAMTCAQHALHHVGHTARMLMLDERLLSQCTPERDLLPRLYELLVELRSMNYRMHREPSLNFGVRAVPYTAEQLRASQHEYLVSLAAGLDKVTGSDNYRAMDYLVTTLQQLGKIEKRLITYNRRIMWDKRKKFETASRNGLPWTRLHERFSLAKSYLEIHSQMPQWRHQNWTLISQLIRTMDTLRGGGTLGDFEATRLSLLDKIMTYYVQSMPQILVLNPEHQQKMLELIETLRYKQLWTEEHLATLLKGRRGGDRSLKQYAMLLPLASTLEAVKLLSDAIAQRCDHALMDELAQAVDDPNSEKAYGFLFKCYMRAFKTCLIAPAKDREYPQLIDHLLQVPRLHKPENLQAAVDNLKILLAPQGHVDTKTILEIAQLKLSKTTKVN